MNLMGTEEVAIGMFAETGVKHCSVRRIVEDMGSYELGGHPSDNFVSATITPE